MDSIFIKEAKALEELKVQMKLTARNTFTSLTSMISKQIMTKRTVKWNAWTYIDCVKTLFLPLPTQRNIFRVDIFMKLNRLIKVHLSVCICHRAEKIVALMKPQCKPPEPSTDVSQKRFSSVSYLSQVSRKVRNVKKKK